MSQRRKWIDRLYDSATWLAAALSTWFLIAIFVFVFQKGYHLLSWDLLTHDYKAENIVASFDLEEQKEAQIFLMPKDLPEEAIFSQKYGIALQDRISADKKLHSDLVYIDENSPLHEAYITTAGEKQGSKRGLELGMSVLKLRYLDAEGNLKTAGRLASQNSEKLVETLEEQAITIKDYYAQSKGGGIRGAVLATLILMGLTLLFALPLGISAAIYLHELAPQNRYTDWMRSSIDLLAGVPSIVFGLLGMTLFYPITHYMGIKGQSILLGSWTMAVLLLPIIIRQTEEALINVPVSMRMGSLALGATKTQTIFRVVLPQALAGILTATLLSISRIIGESAALIYTMGAALNDYPAWNKGGTSLAVQIWSVVSGEQPNFELASAISIVILIMVLILNLSVKVLTYHLSKKNLAQRSSR